MRTLVLVSSLIALGALALRAGEHQPAGPPPARVAVFDSRAIAVAYARSPAFAERLRELSLDHDAAKERDDEERRRALEEQGAAMQEHLHRQAFGTESVAGILESFTAEMAAIADQAQVDTLVSRWDLAWQRPGARFADVTDELVKLFQPDAETLRLIDDLRRRQPLKPDAIDHDH